MIRDIIYNKWIIGGIIYIIIIIGVCYLWYQHDTAAARKAAIGFTEVTRKWEAIQDVETESIGEQAADIPMESKTQTTDKATNQIIAAVTEEAKAETQQPTDTPVETAGAVDMPISSFGFGPYPEVPEGCPVNPNLWGRVSEDMELLFRVAIRKWNEGERFNGASTNDGKVYLHYPNTLYVKYRTVENENGSFTKRITHTKSGNISLSQQQMRDGQIPHGIRVLELDREGINPYEYLELP